MMRAPMDEGVLCFPYGMLLDKAFELINNLQKIVDKEVSVDQVNISTSKLIELSRKAKLHYAKHVEPEVEKRMSEVSRLQATARLQRIDSFLVENQVSKIERVSNLTVNQQYFSLSLNCIL